MLREARSDILRGSTVYELHDLLDLFPIVGHLKHNHVLVGVGAKVRLAGRREMQQDFAQHLIDKHVLSLGEGDMDVPQRLESRHDEALVFLVGLRWTVPWRRDAGRMENLLAVCGATGYDSFGSVGVESCHVAIGCLDKGVTYWRHFGGNLVQMSVKAGETIAADDWQTQGEGDFVYLYRSTVCMSLNLPLCLVNV